MTGQDLLYGLSFVDGRFIAEADTAVLGRKVPWMKVLSAAACLCILIVGALALEQLGHKGAKEEAAPAAAAPEAVQESAINGATGAAPRQEETKEEADSEEAGVTAAGELQHVPHATVRIVRVLEEGSFEAVVEAVTREPTPLEIGLQVKLVFDPTKIPGETREIQIDLSKLLVDVEVNIENGAYDEGLNTLYAAEAFFTEED